MKTLLSNLKKGFSSRPFLVLVCIGIILFSNNNFDYEEYEKQWTHILQGGNPWEAWSNVYGPAHNLMAYLYALHHKGPRLLFGLGCLLISFYLFARIEKNPEMESMTKNKLQLLAFFNPIIWIFIVVNGCNDGLIAVLFLGAILFYDKEKYLWAAFLIALATLYKYIPIFVLPFLFISKRKINWKFALSFSFLTIFGLLISYWIWGVALFNPIRYNSLRASKILSIFRFLRGDYSPFQLIGIDNLDFLSSYLVVLAMLLLFIFYLRYNVQWYQGVLLSLLCLHLLYMVGHFQYYILIVLLFLFFINKDFQEIKALHPDLLWYLWLFIGWICFCTILYAATEGFYRHFAFIREFIGLPTFIINFLALRHLLKYTFLTNTK